jgi:hypothetical protein
MGKATQRREKREAGRLQELAEQNPECFLKEWRTRIEHWATEIHLRARAEHDENVLPSERLRIFGVLEKAERLLGQCGDQARELVGADTRRILQNECCKAVARLTDRRIYRLNNNESNYSLMKSGSHRPPR